MNKIAVECKTKEEWRAVIDKARSEGKEWIYGLHEDHGYSFFDGYKDRYLCIGSELTHASRGHVDQSNYSIIPASEYLAPPLDQLEKELAEQEAKTAALRKKVEEAKKIKVGDWVVYLESGGCLQTGHLYKVSSESLYGTGVHLEGEGPSDWWYYERFRKATPAEIAAHLAEITILVDGTTYKAEFWSNVVKFGCAEIDNDLFRQAKELLKVSGQGSGNRSFEAIQIGKGLFTRELINRICERLT